MKDNFIHVCFVIDESGSMWGSEEDVRGGFKKVIEEQKANTSGTCSVSLYKFENKVTEVYRGKDVNEVEDLKYTTGGSTALFDGVGTAIDNIGKWIDSMEESEKPEKNLIVIMTDGGENSSKEYNGEKVREMIKHQEEKYNWTFVYMGSDLTDAHDANTLGFANRCFSSRADYSKNYDMINSVVSCYRCSVDDVNAKSAILTNSLNAMCLESTTAYAAANNLSADELLNNTEK